MILSAISRIRKSDAAITPFSGKIYSEKRIRRKIRLYPFLCNETHE
jgi:hypothetical protein